MSRTASLIRRRRFGDAFRSASVDSRSWIRCSRSARERGAGVRGDHLDELQFGRPEPVRTARSRDDDALTADGMSDDIRDLAVVAVERLHRAAELVARSSASRPLFGFCRRCRWYAGGAEKREFGYAAPIIAAMNDQSVPVSVSRFLCSASLSFRGCFQCIPLLVARH